MEKPIVKSLGIPGVKLITLPKFCDERGQNLELYDFHFLRTVCEDFIVKTISLSRSKKGVIRGMHSDAYNTKCLKVNKGMLQFFLIDMREDSPTFEKAVEILSRAEDDEWIVIPPKVVNGTAALEDSEMLYLWSHGYCPIKDQIHVKWNKYPLRWMVQDPVLSDRDK